MKARRPWACPLVPLYAAGLAVKDGLRALGVLQEKKLRWPVVSVGSLSAGGAGKTPVVIALAELLQGRGWAVDVLSRGYRRSGQGVARVEAEPEDAARFGDEPVLIAQRAGVPVWVGTERYAAGRAAEADGAACGVHLLDDGFQHRQLARAVDVVLVTAEDFDDALLPAGNRRERLAALRRADVLVVREEEKESVLAGARRYLGEGAVVWEIRRRISLPEAKEAAKGYIAFCALARPENFLHMLEGAGVAVLEAVIFPDHHAYSSEDVRRLVETQRRASAGGFVTTEKDAVKLSAAMRADLEAAGALSVVRLECEFSDEAVVVRELEARIR